MRVLVVFLLAGALSPLSVAQGAIRERVPAGGFAEFGTRSAHTGDWSVYIGRSRLVFNEYAENDSSTWVYKSGVVIHTRTLKDGRWRFRAWNHAAKSRTIRVTFAGNPIDKPTRDR